MSDYWSAKTFDYEITERHARARADALATQVSRRRRAERRDRRRAARAARDASIGQTRTQRTVLQTLGLHH